ncbi:MAG: hypothetical protein NTZ16_14460 [Verrucomicrobia bacterium]|nr:hypothetical protein [Verrucomicrobiota bacterium]
MRKFINERNASLVGLFGWPCRREHFPDFAPNEGSLIFKVIELKLQALKSAPPIA